MKCSAKVPVLMISLVFLFSCDLETHVINTVHKDGSVTRKVIMKGDRDDVSDPEMYRVPLDSTWNMEASFEVGENNDTTWIITAEKWYPGVEEINQEYGSDRGINSMLDRRAGFRKSFRWFTTVYRFSEQVGSLLDVQVPASEFLDDEQLKFFYLPGQAQQNLLDGPDSTSYKELEAGVDSLAEVWMWTAFVRQWIDLFYDRFGDDPGLQISREEMMAKDALFISQLIEQDDEGENENSKDTVPADSANGEQDDDMANVIIPVLGADFYARYRAEIDSAGSELETMLEPYFQMGSYDMEIRMPGRIIASNGFALTGADPEEDGHMLWTVSGDYCLSQNYEMWVESQESHYWAWIVTGVFLVFVITGLVLRRRRRKNPACSHPTEGKIIAGRGCDPESSARITSRINPPVLNRFVVMILVFYPMVMLLTIPLTPGM